MKRFGFGIGVALLAFAVLALALMQRGDDARAQGTAAPVLVWEVQSWVPKGLDPQVPSQWQWQQMENGALHVAFFPAGACVDIALPAGVTATYADQDGATATIAGPSDEPVRMCEAVFARANG